MQTFSLLNFQFDRHLKVVIIHNILLDVEESLKTTPFKSLLVQKFSKNL